MAGFGKDSGTFGSDFGKGSGSFTFGFAKGSGSGPFGSAFGKDSATSAFGAAAGPSLPPKTVSVFGPSSPQCPSPSPENPSGPSVSPQWGIWLKSPVNIANAQVQERALLSDSDLDNPGSGFPTVLPDFQVLKRSRSPPLSLPDESLQFAQGNTERNIPRKEIPVNRRLPKRIILVRHGESQGNLDTSAYTTTPDYRIPITTLGIEQAHSAGERIRQVVSEDGQLPNWKVYFYVSPYERTRMTLREMGRSFSKKRIIGVREECRIREQDFGNFQVEEGMKLIKENRERFGRFFFRFPEGESAADVFDRISSFMESLWRDIDMNRLNRDNTSDINLIIISHGLTSRVFLTKWFKWTVDQFERLNNFGNCEFRVMQLGSGGEYSLAIHHTKEEMEQWGLSKEMIADQQWRASAHRGDWNYECPWYFEAFFDNLPDSDDDDGAGDGRI